MPCRNATVGGSGHAALVLAGQEATGEWEIGELAESKSLTSRKHISFSGAVNQVVVVLSADEASRASRSGNPVGVGNLPTRKIRITDVANLAFMDEVAECAQRFFNGRVWVGQMKLVEVDVVGL